MAIKIFEIVKLVILTISVALATYSFVVNYLKKMKIKTTNKEVEDCKKQVIEMDKKISNAKNERDVAAFERDKLKNENNLKELCKAQVISEEKSAKNMFGTTGKKLGELKKKNVLNELRAYAHDNNLEFTNEVRETYSNMIDNIVKNLNDWKLN